MGVWAYGRMGYGLGYGIGMGLWAWGGDGVGLGLGYGRMGFGILPNPLVWAASIDATPLFAKKKKKKNLKFKNLKLRYHALQY